MHYRNGALGVAGVTLIAVGCARMVHFCAGCKPPASADSVPMSAQQSAILTMYAAEMAQCREKAIKARRIEVFDECADEVDRRYPR